MLPPKRLVFGIAIVASFLTVKPPNALGQNGPAQQVLEVHKNFWRDVYSNDPLKKAAALEGLKRVYNSHGSDAKLVEMQVAALTKFSYPPDYNQAANEIQLAQQRGLDLSMAAIAETLLQVGKYEELK